MTAVKRYYLARNRDHERVMNKITERDKPFLKIPGDEWVRAEDYDALADRLGALCAALQIAADSFRSHGFAVDADECEAAIAPAAREPKPVCRECGQFLDSRGRCRIPEHNS